MNLLLNAKTTRTAYACVRVETATGRESIDLSTVSVSPYGSAASAMEKALADPTWHNANPVRRTMSIVLGENIQPGF